MTDHRESGARGLVLIAVGALLAVAAFVYGVRTPAAIPGGPLAREQGVTIGVRAAVDQPVSIALLGIRNRSDATAEIRSVELVDSDPRLVFVGALVGPGISPTTGSDDRFPPRLPAASRRAKLVQAEGAEMRPGETVHVFVGFAASAPGKHGFDRVAVRYRLRGLPYRAAYGLGGVVCAPADARYCKEIL